MRMIPSTPHDTESQAELKVFDRLKATFADQSERGLTAFHSLNLPLHADKRFGEIDFVIVGRPGLYALEVKGGGVACHDGLWTTRNRASQQQSLRESPFRQAETALHGLVQCLRKQLGDHVVDQFTIGYGVIFPDCPWSAQSAEWDPATLADLGRSRDLERWLKGLFAHWRERDRGRVREPTDDALKAVRQFLRPRFEVAVPLHVRLEEIEAKVAALTEDQMWAIDVAEDNQRVLCSGGAGTGKTFLALELARRWAFDGRQVLLACRSPWLRHWLAARFALPNVTVAVVDAVATAARRAGVERFDALIVDEGQDLFSLALLDRLDRVLVGGLERGHWCLFHDMNNQAGLFGAPEPDALALLDSYQCARVPLSRNCRNTRQILDLIKSTLGADMGVRGTGDGPDVALHRTDDTVGAARLLAAELNRLIERGGLEPAAVTILSPRPFAQSTATLLPPPWAGRISVLDEFSLRNFPPAQVSFAGIAEFKGLENEAIIVVDLPLPVNQTTATPEYYVSMSRARASLSVIYTKMDGEVTRA